MALTRLCLGSSPRLRGTRSRLLRLCVPTTVHPRACGEHAAPEPDRLSRRRFIPAPAGNTRKQWSARTPMSVHPRACGEHERHGWQEYERYGSSPRLRGTPGYRTRQRLRPRFIPAPAGNTFSRRPCRLTAPVHPRACGEHSRCLFICDRITGSSPRLRGTHQEGERAAGLLRFIPAPAGNTYAVEFLTLTLPVHPRACGEHLRRARAAS